MREWRHDRSDLRCQAPHGAAQSVEGTLVVPDSQALRQPVVIPEIYFSVEWIALLLFLCSWSH
jgi:hypothetical protein